jgi:hypothetical protein
MITRAAVGDRMTYLKFSALLSYVNNAEFHDVVLEIHGKQIYAHKVILAARSQYFDAMFSSDMVEAKQYVLSITDDISVETFLLVVRTDYFHRHFL